MFHANGWTFVWIVTAVGGTHVCLRRSSRQRVFELLAAERVTMLCAAPTVLIGIANAPAELRAQGAARRARADRRRAPAAATIERIEGELGWDVTQVYGLTETAPFITDLRAAPRARGAAAGGAGRDQGAPGRRADHLGRAAGGRRRRAARSRATAQTHGRDRGPRQRRHGGLLQRPRGDRARRSATAGSTPATPRSCIRTATWRSATA